MAWPTTLISTDHVADVTDSPAAALPAIKRTIDSLNLMIQAYNSARGVAALNASGKLSTAYLPTPNRGLSFNNSNTGLGHTNLINIGAVGGANKYIEKLTVDAHGHVTQAVVKNAADIGLALGATQTHLFYYAGHLPTTSIGAELTSAPTDGTLQVYRDDLSLQTHFLSENSAYSAPPIYFSIPSKEVVVVGVSRENVGSLQTFYHDYKISVITGINTPPTLVSRWRKYTVQFQRYNIRYKELT